jgi:proliferating cell nuclear antigen
LRRLDSDRIAEYEMKLMEIDADTLGIPETEYDARVTMPSAEFARIVRDLSQLGESVRIEVSKEGVRFASEGEAANGNVLLKQTDGAITGGKIIAKKEAGEDEDNEEEGEGKAEKKKKIKKEKSDDDVDMTEDQEEEFKPGSDDEGEEEQDPEEDEDEDEESGKKRKKKASRFGSRIQIRRADVQDSRPAAAQSQLKRPRPQKGRARKKMKTRKESPSR